MQPTDLQLFFLNAAIAVLIGGCSTVGREFVGKQERLKFKSEQVEQYDVGGLKQNEPSDETDYSRRADEGHKCYLHITQSWKDVVEVTCDRNTVGCVTWVNITKDGWHGLFPPVPFKDYVCLNASDVQRRPIGKCDCLSSKCICYCLGSNCNNRERITSITEEYDNHGTRRQSLPSWAKILLVAAALIVTMLLLLVMFFVCIEVVTKRSRYSHPPVRNETELVENWCTNGGMQHTIAADETALNDNVA